MLGISKLIYQILNTRLHGITPKYMRVHYLQTNTKDASYIFKQIMVTWLLKICYIYTSQEYYY